MGSSVEVQRRRVAIAIAVALVCGLVWASPSASLEATAATTVSSAMAGTSAKAKGRQVRIRVRGQRFGKRVKVTLKGIAGKATGVKRTVKVKKTRTVRRLTPGRYKVRAKRITKNGRVARVKKIEPRRVAVTKRRGATTKIIYRQMNKQPTVPVPDPTPKPTPTPTVTPTPTPTPTPTVTPTPTPTVTPAPTPTPTVTPTPTPTPTSQDQLTEFSKISVFFGHQSVGGNVLGGVRAVYSDSGLDQPVIVQSRTALDEDGGFLQHAYVGRNGDPLGKIRDFDAMIRGGVGDAVDVALMKLCYVDITKDTDVANVFGEYKTTMAALERDYPGVSFVHVTAPVTTVGVAHNVAREKFNGLMRAEYGDTGNIFDLAAAESTTPQGDRVGGESDGQPYYALYEGYARDSGHLNDLGATVAAKAFIETAVDAASSQ